MHVKYLVVMDMDGTITYNISWKDLHEYFGTLESALKNKEEFLKGKISYGEWMQKDIALWNKPSYEEVKEVLLKYKVREGFDVFCNMFKENSVLAIVSAGIDIRAYDIAANYGIHKVFANPLLIEHGKVIGGIPLVSINSKEKIFEALKRKYNPETVICIGDSVYDTPMLEKSDIGIAFDEIEHADFVASDFFDVVKYLKSRVEM